MAVTNVRLDDQTYGAFMRELLYVEQRVRERQYPDKPAAQGKIIPIETLTIPWAEQTSFRMEDGVGEDFELADDLTTGLSMVQLTGEGVTQNIYQFRKGYDFTEKEIIRTTHLGLPVEERKIALVNKLYIQTLNKLVLFGHSLLRLPGLLNHPAFLRMVAPYPLNSTSTPEQQLATLSAGGEAMRRATENMYSPKELLLPRSTYTYLVEQARFGSSPTDMTVLNFFLKNNTSIRNIGYLNELEGAGPGGEDLAIFYTRDPNMVKARITDPMRFRQYIQQPFGMIRPVAFDFNGLICYEPYSVLIMILPK